MILNSWNVAPITRDEQGISSAVFLAFTKPLTGDVGERERGTVQREAGHFWVRYHEPSASAADEGSPWTGVDIEQSTII
jgi:hypothetical protein